MERQQLRRLLRADTQLILDAFSSRQYLRPHQSLREMLPDVTRDTGCCPLAIEQAMAWLDLDPAVSIGRLCRSELMQLARSIQRFWRNAQNRAMANTREV